jgi:hypothetical protein
MMTAFNNSNLYDKNILKHLCEENKSILDKERLKLKKNPFLKSVFFLFLKLSII